MERGESRGKGEIRRERDVTERCAYDAIFHIIFPEFKTDIIDVSS